jgi:hypothetical protein
MDYCIRCMLTTARPRESNSGSGQFKPSTAQQSKSFWHMPPAVDYFHFPQPSPDHFIHPFTTRPAQISDRNSPSQRALPALTARTFHPAIVTLILV